MAFLRCHFSAFPLRLSLCPLLLPLNFLAGIAHSLLLLLGYNGFPDIDVADQVGCATLSFWSHSPLFSQWRRTVSSKFFYTYAPKFFRNLCSLITLAVPSLVFVATDTSLLLNISLSRIGTIENPLRSACSHPTQDISHLILHCPATDSVCRSLYGDSFSLRSLFLALKSCLASWASWSFAMLPFLRRGRVNNNTQTCYTLARNLVMLPEPGSICVQQLNYRNTTHLFLLI